MKGNCTYCKSLSKAIQNQNYCSNQGDAIQSVSSNAYYFKTNSLQSGEHVSRISIRTISDGYQRHYVDKQDFMLDRNHFLMINEGASFESEVKTEQPIEGLLLAFNKTDYLTVQKFWSQSDTELLDDPFNVDNQFSDFSAQRLFINEQMRAQLESLRQSMLKEGVSRLYYQQVFNSVLSQAYLGQNHLLDNVWSLKAKKKSTKLEIFKRCQSAKDYIDNNLSDNLTLESLSKVATLSPFHFQRCFQKIFEISPHGYLIKQRLRKVEFLLRDTPRSVRSIAQDVGFQNQSSFGRLFKKWKGQTPLSYRLANG